MTNQEQTPTNTSQHLEKIHLSFTAKELSDLVSQKDKDSFMTDNEFCKEKPIPHTPPKEPNLIQPLNKHTFEECSVYGENFKKDTHTTESMYKQKDFSQPGFSSSIPASTVKPTHNYQMYVHPDVKDFIFTIITQLDSPNCSMGCYQNQGIIVRFSTKRNDYCFLVPINSDCKIPDEDKARMYSRSLEAVGEMAKRVPALDLPRTKEDEFYHRLNVTPSSSGLAVLTLVVCSKDFRRQTVYQSLIDNDGELTSWKKDEESSKQHSCEQTQTNNPTPEITFWYDTPEELIVAYNNLMVVVSNYALSLLSADSKDKNDQHLKELIDEFTTQTLKNRLRR